MENKRDPPVARLVGNLVSYLRKLLFCALSVGPIPGHLAFILDGNRRYARKWGLAHDMGHRAGFLALMTLLKYCYELGVRHVTIYAFSIDNFKRQPHEVQSLMDLMLEKIQGLLKEESIVKQYGVRILFIGKLHLLHGPVRAAAEQAMRATAGNEKTILLICVAYTSTDEILRAAQRCCEDAAAGGGGDGGCVVRVADLERQMYLGMAPGVDILVRTSGETRLSNFLTWQTSGSLLCSLKALWPEFGLRHLVWAVLEFQRLSPYLEKRKKQ